MQIKQRGSNWVPGWSCGITRLLDQEGEEAASGSRQCITNIFSAARLWDKGVRIASIVKKPMCEVGRWSSAPIRMWACAIYKYEKRKMRFNFAS